MTVWELVRIAEAAGGARSGGRRATTYDRRSKAERERESAALRKVAEERKR